MESLSTLLIPAFLAGVLTFLAPCTFPLIPGFIGLISGTTLQHFDATKQTVRRRVFLNAVMYVLGFSIVFIALGSLVGLAGSAFGRYRELLTRIGGVLVIFFGVYMLGLYRLRWFSVLLREKKFHARLLPGKPVSAFLFGAAFAFGWTPCIGPILGSILFLAGTRGTVGEGALLLVVFSLGLAIPFLLLAIAIGRVVGIVKRVNRYLHVISFVGGALLIFIGAFLLFDRFTIFLSYFYQWFHFINYEAILHYL